VRNPPFTARTITGWRLVARRAAESARGFTAHWEPAIAGSAHALTTRIDYLSGFRKQITNPLGKITTISYQAYGAPSEDMPVRIVAPEGQTTVIARDAYGKPLNISRNSLVAGVSTTARVGCGEVRTASIEVASEDREMKTGTEDRDSLKSEISYKLSGAFPMQLRPGKADASSMTSARAILVPPESPGTYHCVSRCVRRAWLCGTDRETGRSFEHRRQWVEDRIHELSEIFAVAIWGYAVMSNHLHVVVQVIPEASASWNADEVAKRWTRLYPRENQDSATRAQALAGNEERIKELRKRLASLSWFMRRLAEPIARRANREDGCKGHFWEARFKCQTLLDDTAVLSAMAYVDLNPVRAKVCDSLEASEHTSARARIDVISTNRQEAECALGPVLGLPGFGVQKMSQADYLELVDHTSEHGTVEKIGVKKGLERRALAGVVRR